MFLHVSVLFRTSQEFCNLVYFSQTVVRVFCLFSYLFRISLKSILDDYLALILRVEEFSPFFPLKTWLALVMKL